MLELRDGKIQVQTKNNKRKNSGLVDFKVNDGNWHHVLVTYAKKRKSLNVALDGTRDQNVRVQKSKINRELYIGGLPDNITDLKKLVCKANLNGSAEFLIYTIIFQSETLELIQFRGCIRSLKINKQPQSLVSNKNTKHSRIGQCFSTVEQGSYFGGDAYAVYSA